VKNNGIIKIGVASAKQNKMAAHLLRAYRAPLPGKKHRAAAALKTAASQRNGGNTAYASSPCSGC